MNADRLLYRVSEAADAIGVSRAHCYELIARGIVPHIRLGGGSIRVPRAALEALVTQQLAEQARAEAAGR
ncbi:MAG: hypothetical protein A3G76_12570 [Acidobacteria bacterium RIFCSPLOWO2_12_FULL_65_11]|nr:MAG: hypothetical protein A3H95_13905 [Acidobacteria bacterium RIFCSPLOWO2_02_FULL_64_15]OFW34403.1 MAG: hypothetical protein A3G76_12570 [Acidobacteria bacterium RIFCSPLOWO2_12_FULL_65_11]